MNEDTALVERDEHLLTTVGGPGVLEARNPSAFIAKASSYATALAQVIEEKQLYKNIQGKKYTLCEGWTTLASMCGLFPFEVSNEDVGGGVYVSTVELRSAATGMRVARASAECGAPDELDKNGNPTWADRAAYARRSMAATRATSKVCRLALSWVMVLAGYAPTPAEEMDFIEGEVVRESKPRQPQPQRRSSGGREWDGNLVVKSGKHKGQKWSELPKGFLEWALDQDGPVKDMAAKEMGRRAAEEPEQPPFPEEEGPF